MRHRENRELIESILACICIAGLTFGFYLLSVN